MAELKYWIWLNELGINPVLTHRLLDYFGGPMEVFFAERGDFAKIPDVAFRSFDLEALTNQSLDRVYKIQDEMQALGGRILTQQDAEYPQRLRDIDDAPFVLYVRGRLPVVDDEAAVVIAGTRKCSPYGYVAAKQIAGEVTRHGGLVVSGLAAGIDTAAAEGALREGGSVVGVLGCGLERVYPAENVAVFEEVLQNGALVSEYPPGTEPRGRNFPRRNRIMTGLSLALVAVEIPTEKSGTMHSVDHAISQGRDVFVVPANIDSPTSKHSNELIADGYQAASTGWHVLRDYASRYAHVVSPEMLMASLKPAGRETPPPRPLDRQSKSSTKKVIDKAKKEDYIIDLKEALKNRSEAEQAIAAILDYEPKHVDEIISACNLPVQKVNVCLTTLEIAGLIRAHPGKRYSLAVDG